MTYEEAVTLTRLIADACPEQRISDIAADSWKLVLDDLPFDDCLAAVRRLIRTSSEVTPGDIRAAVSSTRTSRLEHYVVPAPPVDIADDPVRYLEYLRTMRRRVADGEVAAVGSRRDRPFVDRRPPAMRGPIPEPRPGYAAARDFLGRLPDLGDAWFKQARSQLGEGADIRDVVIRAAELGRESKLAEVLLRLPEPGPAS